ncbi:hypothetical protein SASPL_121478 [Salvia splendens]|uniref:Uncharacterized protein n=1 Tax=Salvia splendens TaxID=180675 RepID=A0A8X8ZW46_SALSN|nr:hypothetical protein SASPL_121478 [Salvia splendens]
MVGDIHLSKLFFILKDSNSGDLQISTAITENKFSSSNNGGEGRFIQNGEFGWFADFESANCTMLESPMLAEDRISADSEMAMIFTMREEDESLFADLGELPECSTVFRRGLVESEAAGIGDHRMRAGDVT